MVDDEIDNEEHMYLLCWPFWWPCVHVGAMLLVLPNVACPGLHRKPLDATTGQLLAQYCPSSHQGNSKQTNDVKLHLLCWPFWWPCQCAGTLTCASPNGGGPWLHQKPLDTAIGQVFAPIGAIGHADTAISSCYLAGCHWGWRNVDLIRWKLDRSVFQTNRKDREDVMEHLNGGAELVEQHYDDWFLYCTGFSKVVWSSLLLDCKESLKNVMF